MWGNHHGTKNGIIWFGLNKLTEKFAFVDLHQGEQERERERAREREREREERERRADNS